jgi:multidrug efflux pump subunit AcrA (membrane-fusion protein)
MIMKTKRLLISSLTIFFFAFLLTACQSTLATPAQTEDLSKTLEPNRRSSGFLIFEGEAVPVRHVTLSFPINGVVDDVLVKEGDTVKQGDLLARLKGSEKQKAAISAAESELLSAKKALDDLNNNANVARAEAQLAMANAKKALDKAVENRNYKITNERTNGILTRPRGLSDRLNDLITRKQCGKTGNIKTRQIRTVHMPCRICGCPKKGRTGRSQLQIPPW